MKIYFINLFRMSVVVSFIILLVIMITPITQKKYSNKWRYWLWLVLCLLLIVPINIEMSKPLVIISLDNVQTMESTYMSIENKHINNAVSEINEFMPQIEQVDIKEKDNPINIMESAILIWILGALLFFSLNIILYIRYVRENKVWSYKSDDEIINNIFSEIKNKMGVNSKVGLRICENVNSPMLMGLLKPMVILPKGDFKKDELEHIFAHELAHYKRYDIWFKMLLLIVRSLHWFNPFIFIMGKMASADIELCCDDHVIKDYDIMKRAEYAQTIINIMKLKKNKRLMLTTNFNGGKKFMKRRIKILVNSKRNKRGVTIFIGMLLFAILLQGLVACKSVDENIDNKITSKEETIQVTDQFESDDIDFSQVKYILSEEKRNLKLEKAVAKEMFEEYYSEDEYPKYRYLYNYVDLNGDSKNEVFVLLMGMYFSGSGGSTGVIFEEDGDSYKSISNFSLVRSPIIISDDKTNGWKDIIMQVSGGGHPLSYNILKFDGNKYPSNPSVQPEVEKGTTVTGLGIIADKITPESGIKYPANSDEK